MRGGSIACSPCFSVAFFLGPSLTLWELSMPGAIGRALRLRSSKALFGLIVNFVGERGDIVARMRCLRGLLDGLIGFAASVIVSLGKRMFSVTVVVCLSGDIS